MDKNILEKLVCFLEQAITETIDSYRNFICLSKKDEKKDFLKHHTAAMKAISHLESLLAIKQKVEAEISKNPDEGQNVKSLISEACQRIARQKNSIKKS